MDVFLKIPAWAYQFPELGITELFILGRINAYQSSGLKYFESKESLSKIMRVNRASVFRSLTKLKNLGLVQCERNGRNLTITPPNEVALRDHSAAMCNNTVALCDYSVALCDPAPSADDRTVAVCDSTVAVCDPPSRTVRPYNRSYNKIYRKEYNIYKGENLKNENLNDESPTQDLTLEDQKTADDQKPKSKPKTKTADRKPASVELLAEHCQKFMQENESKYPYFKNINPATIADEIWWHYEGNGWSRGKTPISNWRAVASKWLTSNYTRAAYENKQPQPLSLTEKSAQLADEVRRLLKNDSNTECEIPAQIEDLKNDGQ